MNPRDDSLGEMHEFPFDNSDADAVFGASSGSDSVPEDLRDVAELVYVARGPGSMDELTGEDVVVAQIAGAIREHAAPPRGGANERISVLNKVRSARLTAAATAALLLGGTAAAAATGSLPSPAHRSAATTRPAVSVPAHATVELASSLHRQSVKQHAVDNAAAKKALAKKLAAKRLAAHLAAVKAHEHHRAVGGTVASVNGVTDPGTCGTAGAAGAFTVTHDTKTFTVNVDPATTFLDKDVDPASFANVCVGMLTLAKGTIADTTVTATKVFLAPARQDDGNEHEKHGAFGTVTAVNGVTDAGTCGTAGATGSFTLQDHDGVSFTVNVDPSTKFDARGMDDESFAKVCVGEKVGVFGDVTDTTIAATKAFVFGDHDPGDHHDCDGSKNDGHDRKSGGHDGNQDGNQDHKQGDRNQAEWRHRGSDNDSSHDSERGSRHGR